MMRAPRFRVLDLQHYERDVRFRMPFRFGVVTLTAAPQAFLRARIRLEDGRESEGAAAEMLAPKWFDKNPALTNEQNFDQLRLALGLAREAYLATTPTQPSDTGSTSIGRRSREGAAHGLNSLTACFGPALVDRALLDALCRALGVSSTTRSDGTCPAWSRPPGTRIWLASTWMPSSPASGLRARWRRGIPSGSSIPSAPPTSPSA